MNNLTKRLRAIAVLQPTGKRVIEDTRNTETVGRPRVYSGDDRAQRHRDAAREYARLKRLTRVQK